MYRIIRRGLRFVKHRIVTPIVYYGAVFFPVKQNKVAFDCFSGKGYGCNPKYIAEALLNREDKPDMVWFVNNMGEEIPEGIRKVKYGSLKAAYELATAKVWVDNVRSSFRVKKKKSQYYIQTWHSSVGLKMAEKEIEDKLSPAYVKAAKRDGKIADIMISDGPYRTNRYYKWYWYEGEVLEGGLPRFDILVNPREEVRQKMYKSLKIPQNKKIVLYAPTFRSTTRNSENPTEVYQFDYEACRKHLEEVFGGEYVFLLRLHPNVQKDSEAFSYSDTVINVSSYGDMQELLAFSDVLITDYSSCMFEAMYVHHKVFLFAKDFEEYIAKERELLFSIDELPCPLAKSEDELYKKISGFQKEQYEKECMEFFADLGVEQSGHASDTVADLIMQKCFGDK